MGSICRISDLDRILGVGEDTIKDFYLSKKGWKVDLKNNEYLILQTEAGIKWRSLIVDEGIVSVEDPNLSLDEQNELERILQVKLEENECTDSNWEKLLEDVSLKQRYEVLEIMTKRCVSTTECAEKVFGHSKYYNKVVAVRIWVQYELRNFHETKNKSKVIEEFIKRGVIEIKGGEDSLS